MTYAIFAMNRFLMFFFGAVSVAVAATAAIMGRPASVLFGLTLFAVLAISYSRFQWLPPLLQRSLGFGANAFALLAVLRALLLDWRTQGPSVTAPFAAAVIGFALGVPLVQLLRGRTPPALVWRGRA